MYRGTIFSKAFIELVDTLEQECLALLPDFPFIKKTNKQKISSKAIKK